MKKQALLALTVAALFASCNYGTKTESAGNSNNNQSTFDIKKEKWEDKQARREGPKYPSLYEFQVKRIANRKLVDERKNDVYTEVKIGYYQCNDESDRLRLYKLEANNLVTLSCEDIVKKDGSVSYWVNVELTDKGRKLLSEKDRQPENCIDMKAAKAALSPKSGKDAYGRYIFTEADSATFALVDNFLRAWFVSPAEARANFCSRDFREAYNLINLNAGFNDKPLDALFLLKDSNIEDLSVVAWSKYNDAYIVCVGKVEAVFVINSKDGALLIDDIASATTLKALNAKETYRTQGEKIDNAKLNKARRDQAKREAELAKKAQKPSKEKAEPKDPDIDYRTYSFTDKPGLVLQEGDLAFDLAAENANSRVVELYAYSIKATRASNLQMVKTKDEKKLPYPVKATAKVVIEVVKVSPVGRIYEDAELGYLHTYNLKLAKYEDGWAIE